jgi:tetratricopeptide (TPR) repeat protein
MASGKFGVQFAFAFVAAALALTAAASIYRDWAQPERRPAANRPAENQSSLEEAEMLSAMEQLAAKNPQNPDYWSQTANLYYDLGQFDRAAEYYQKSLDVRPGDPRIETDLATCFHYLGRSDKALETLDKVLGYRPHFPQAMYNKGLILISGKNDVGGAIRAWEDLLRHNPDFAEKEELEQRIFQLKAAVE